ncbi:2'-5' RNA ligase superfamily-domain-containing protein [Halenospora varia]|nr:2'-5' RNA ligase superfamily-domain-containing protein [Halenospora varia]
MASYTSARYHFNSTQTALALVVPQHLQSEINSLRKLHDKAYHKWEPHINILYPFVHPSLLTSTMGVLRSSFLAPTGPIKVTLSQAGSFKHRRNATVFLKPGEDSEHEICELRRKLVQVLGVDEREGTVDGTFRPHLTVGQAGFIGGGIERLTEMVEKITGIEWVGTRLVALQRDADGVMNEVNELVIGNGPEENNGVREVAPDYVGWRNCFGLHANDGWVELAGDHKDASTTTTTTLKGITISSYNLMVETYAPSFPTRLPLTIEAISSATSSSTSPLKVLCLQEVNEESLPLLLSDPFIREEYPYSTHSPASLLTSHRNLVTLSSRPFTSYILQFPERHKSSLIIKTLCQDIVVANVHLPSALTDESVISKKEHMEILSNFLNSKTKEGSKIFVAGDFNLTSSPSTIQTALTNNLIKQGTAKLAAEVVYTTIWEDTYLRFEGENITEEEIADGAGATFDRSGNPLAGLSTKSPIDDIQQRYDRILYRKSIGNDIEVEAFERFGFPNEEGECASDHYGVCATMTIRNGIDIAKDSAKAMPSSTDLRRTIQLVEDATDITPLISHLLPAEADKEQRESALILLQNTLAASSHLKDVIIAPLGSYAMDTYFKDSDMDLLAIGSVAPNSFFDLAVVQLKGMSIRGNGSDGVKAVHFVNSLVPIIEVVVGGVKVDLQYCQAEELIHRYHNTKPTPNLQDLAFDPTLIKALPTSSLRPLNTYRDTAFLLHTNPHPSPFRTAHRYFSLYLRSSGLYSAKFGYLGGIHLSLMLSRVMKLLPPSPTPPSPASIIRTFFEYYAGFDFRNEILCDPSQEGEVKKGERKETEPVFIRSIHTPTARLNVAGSCTKLSSQLITSSFLHASKQLQEGSWDPLISSPSLAAKEFLNRYGAYIRTTLDVWDVDELGGARVREIVGALESKFVRLMISLGRIEGISAQVWPMRFYTTPSPGSASQTELKGHYFVGIEPLEGVSKDQKSVLSGKITTAVRGFEGEVREGRGFEEGGNVWVEMGVLGRKKVGEMGLELDWREWGANVSSSPPSSTTVAKGDSADDVTEPYLNTPSLPTSSHSSDPNPNQTSTPSKSKHNKSSSTSLRPAQDILSRIRWDPDLNVDNFMVGYEDRFAGVKEIELAKWKGESTHEEFIPLHRVVWVRRKGVEEKDSGEGDMGGVKVWDRRSRVDWIFGSGVGRG